MRRFLISTATVATAAGLFITGASAAEACKCVSTAANGLCSNMVCQTTKTTTASKTVTKKKKEDVKVTIKASDRDVIPGDDVTFKIKVTNDGEEDTETTVNATFDRDLTFVSANKSGDDVSSREVEWDSLSVDAGETVTLSLRLRVRTGVRDGDDLEVNVEAGDDEDSTEVTVDNSGTSSGNGYVRLSITDSSDTVRIDDVVTYTLEITNNDRGDATVNVYGYLDANTNFVSASDGGYNTSGNLVQWQNIRIPQYDTRRLTLQTRVRNTATVGSTLYFRADANGVSDNETTTVGTATGGETCSYYNSYLRVNYDDFCDSRHQNARR